MKEESGRRDGMVLEQVAAVWSAGSRLQYKPKWLRWSVSDLSSWVRRYTLVLLWVMWQCCGGF